MTRTEILKFVTLVVAEETGQPESTVLESHSFANLGVDSLSAIVILNKIEDHFQVELNPLNIWDYPTVGTFTDFLLTHISTKAL